MTEPFTNREKMIWTIGHSTRTAEEFISMLKSFEITLLADIRSFPGSKRYPQFNKASLAKSLLESGVEYLHYPRLGGRRQPKPDSPNTIWRNASFRGYADYMETDEFRDAIAVLESRASEEQTAYMCSEAVWWRCHRALVSDYLKAREWKVIHIVSSGKSTEHPYTSAARVAQGNLFYGN